MQEKNKNKKESSKEKKEALDDLSRRGGSEEISLVQGKEQRLCFAGAAVKRYPMSKAWIPLETVISQHCKYRPVITLSPLHLK
ncbi:hypothetical protein CapIbe_012051 [Capra ibex]